MNYEIINSGSNGNAIIVEKILLLDCGISYTRLKKKLKEVKIIFISHIHSLRPSKSYDSKAYCF